MGKQDKQRFYKLTPTIVKEEEIKSYQTALDYVYGEEDILNIALTGSYGAGKSSIWKTYKKNNDWSNEKCIQVSLASFLTEPPNISNQKGELDDSLPQIEVQILNQILYQVDENKISGSKYRIKKESTFMQGLKILYPWLLILGFLFILFLESTILELVKPYFNPKQINWGKLVLSGIMFLVPTSILIRRLFKYANIKLKNISFQGANVEMESDDQGSLFDKDLDEVVYIIRESGAHTVVFEDLDRFESIQLFTKLRELNYLSNIESNEPIRFIYMIKDDIFLSKERTKFFDFVIPIVPIMDTYNAKGLFLDMFESDMKTMYHPKPQTIERISSYIDEYRLLKNIYNEYSIYKNQIDAVGRLLDADKLLGIITYKNIFPSDFEKLQINQGYVFNLFQRDDELKRNMSKELHKKIASLKYINDELHNWVVHNKAELLLLYLPIERSVTVSGIKNTVEAMKYIKDNPDESFSYGISGRRGTVSGQDIIAEIENNKEYQRRKALLDDHTREDQIIYNENSIRSYEQELYDIKSTNISKLLLSADNDTIRSFFQEQDGDFKGISGEYSEQIVQDHFFPLIKYLIYNGILDETYPEYMGYFYPSSLSNNDSIFIRSIIEGNYLEPDYKLDDVNVIISQLSLEDYNKPGVLNHNLLNSILNKDNVSEFSMLIKMVERKDELQFIDQYLTTVDIKAKKQFVKQLLRILPDQIINFIDSNALTEQNEYDLMFFTLNDNEKVDKYLGGNERFKKIIEKNPKFSENRCRINQKILFINLNDLEIQFLNISSLNLSKELWREIELNNTFHLSVENVTSLILALINFDDEPEIHVLKNQLTILRTEQALSTLFKRISENYTSYLSDYIATISEQDLVIENEYKDLVNACNSEISVEEKREYINRNKTEIINLIDLDDKTIWKWVLKFGRVRQSLNNILEYYSALRDSIDDLLIGYINEFNPENLERLIANNTDSRLQGFLTKVINVQSINLGAVKSFASNCTDKLETLNEKLNNSHIAVLIETLSVVMNKENLVVIAWDKDNLSEFIESKIVEFQNILKDEEVLNFWMETDEDIIYSLIERSILSEEQLKHLISHYTKPLSIFRYRSEYHSVIEYIITNNFDWKDIDEIFETYNAFKYKKEFINLFNDKDKILKLEGTKIPSDFVIDCIESESLTNANIVQIINLSIPSNDRADIKSWLVNFNPTSELSEVFHNRQPILSDEVERQVAQALQEYNYISIKDSENGERVYPKKKARSF